MEAFLIALALYQFIGWCFGVIYFWDVKNLTVLDWILFVPGASLGIMSFGILPFMTIFCTIPVFIDPEPALLILLGFGWHMCFSMYILMYKEFK